MERVRRPGRCDTTQRGLSRRRNSAPVLVSCANSSPAKPLPAMTVSPDRSRRSSICAATVRSGGVHRRQLEGDRHPVPRGTQPVQPVPPEVPAVALAPAACSPCFLGSREGPPRGPPRGSALDGGTSTLGLILLAGVLGVLWAAATPPGALWALGSFTGASLESLRAIPQAATEQSENSHRPPRRRCPAALPIHEERNPGRMTDHPNSDRAPERTQIVVMSFRELQGAGPAGRQASRSSAPPLRRPP